MGKKILKILFAIILRLLILALLAAAGYVAYLFMTYHRLPDTGEQHSDNTVKRALIDHEYTALTWNLGFAAYNRDFSFFMDGGTEGRARSVQHVYDNLVHCLDVVHEEMPEFILFQEVDRKADRSWRIDEAAVIRETLPEHQSYYAQNYNSAYIILPLRSPHGKAKSGILTLSERDIYRSERRQLPVETDWHKLLDLDRCYSMCHIPTENDRELCLFNLHLSAYTSDGSITMEQLRLLLDHMREEYDKGNYVIAGGDFNRDLLGNSGEIFGVSGEAYSWAQPIDMNLFPDGLRLVDSLDRENPVPSCRNCDTGYIPGRTFVVTVDGFIVSDNVEVHSCRVIDDDFLCSDHNPVEMKFSLRPYESDVQDDNTENMEEPTDELGSQQALSGI